MPEPVAADACAVAVQDLLLPLAGGSERWAHMKSLTAFFERRRELVPLAFACATPGQCDPTMARKTYRDVEVRLEAMAPLERRAAHAAVVAGAECDARRLVEGAAAPDDWLRAARPALAAVVLLRGDRSAPAALGAATTLDELVGLVEDPGLQGPHPGPAFLKARRAASALFSTYYVVCAGLLWRGEAFAPAPGEAFALEAAAAGFWCRASAGGAASLVLARPFAEGAGDWRPLAPLLARAAAAGVRLEVISGGARTTARASFENALRGALHVSRRVGGLRECPRCGAREAPAARFLRCGRCRCAYYCSARCQAADWRAGHRELCGTLRETPPPPPGS